MSKLEEALGHHREGRLDDAQSTYREILETEPGNADALHLLGVIALQRSRYDEAVALIEQAIDRDSTAPAYHSNLGEALRALGRFDAAIEAFRASLALRFDNDTLDSLAKTLLAHGPVEQAIEFYLRALRERPEDARARQGLVSLLHTVRPGGPWPELERELVECFRADDVVHQQLAGVAANQLVHRYGLPARLPAADDEVETLVEALSGDPLLHALLTSAINVSYPLERLLTWLRRQFLLERGHTPEPPERLGLLAALAEQCFANEFVFEVDDDESRAVDELGARVCAESSEDVDVLEPGLEARVLRLACYVPLVSLPCAERLAGIDASCWSAPARRIVERALLEPLEERLIEDGIESLGAIDDPTSAAVRAQYEENPYPRWSQVRRPVHGDLSSMLRSRFPDFTPPEFLEAGARVLVAGCGTGQEAIDFALTYPGTEVLGVDLSRRSLAYGARMARELEVPNIRFLHADILGLDALSARFHVVRTSGVLHHMADPLAGWRILVDRLEPSGLMQVALYSETARRPLAAAQTEIARRGIDSSAESIRRFRVLVLEGELGGELTELAAMREFHTLSNCRDLLFHVNEHRFTLEQIGRALDLLGLVLIGFDLDRIHVPPQVHDRIRLDRRSVDLATCERIEKAYPRAFLSMYRFWCRKI